MLSHPLPPPLPSTPRALNSSGAKGRAGRSLAREGSFISIVRRDILAIPRGNRISSRRPPHLSSSSQWPAIIMRNLAEQSDQRQSRCRGLWNCRATHIRHPPSPPAHQAKGDCGGPHCAERPLPNGSEALGSRDGSNLWLPNTFHCKGQQCILNTVTSAPSVDL